MRSAVFCVCLFTAGTFHGWGAERDLVIRSDAGTPIGACDLGATLNTPDPMTALVVFVHGSGPLNRDERISALVAPFKDIAEALSAHGIGSLRFDKRSSIEACRPGMTDSSNPQRSHPALRPEHFIMDIEAVYQRAWVEVPGVPIYLLGHSEGVNYVLELAAQERLDPSGVILLAGLGRYPIDVTLLRQWRNSLQKIKEALSDPTLSQKQREKLEKSQQEIEILLPAGEIFFSKLRSGKTKPEDYFYKAYAPYWKEWIEITERATMTAAQAGKPSLLIQGSRDDNVTKEDFAALAAALQPTGGTSKYLSGLQHEFLRPGSARVDVSVPEDIAAWIKDRSPGATPDAVTGDREDRRANR